jgi:hypothetical protein
MHSIVWHSKQMLSDLLNMKHMAVSEYVAHGQNKEVSGVEKCS